jgi:hypothetical protein
MSDRNDQHIELGVELLHALDSEDNMLVINKGKHHQAFEKVQGHDNPHTITWTLTGNASSGEFCALDELDNPGFVWLIRTPSERIFHKLQRVGKNKLTIHNHHRDKGSEGVWHHQLFARFGEKIYGVPLTFTAGSGNDANPSIKNR